MPRQKKGKLTFIEEARRKQIIDAAIQAIAENGYANSSLATIAEEIGVSKGVISYHFDGKDELITDTYNSLVEMQRGFRNSQIDENAPPFEKIFMFVKSNFEFFKTHETEISALFELYTAFYSQDAKHYLMKSIYDPSHEQLGKYINEGIEDGSINDSNPKNVAILISALLDGIMLQHSFSPSSIDLDSLLSDIRKYMEMTLLKK